MDYTEGRARINEGTPTKRKKTKPFTDSGRQGANTGGTVVATMKEMLTRKLRARIRRERGGHVHQPADTAASYITREISKGGSFYDIKRQKIMKQNRQLAIIIDGKKYERGGKA